MKDSSFRLRLAIGATLVVLVMFAFVYPARAWLGQRAEVNRVRRELSVLERQNDLLQQEAGRLQSPAEIERLARERFNMVRPGEHAFVVVPAAPPESVTTTTLPPTAQTAAPVTSASTAPPTTVLRTTATSITPHATTTTTAPHRTTTTTAAHATTTTTHP